MKDLKKKLLPCSLGALMGDTDIDSFGCVAG